MKWSDYIVPSTKYANHNLSTTKRFTASPGLLYPIWNRVMLPGDKFKINLRSLFRTNPVKAPLMGSFKVRFVTVASNFKNYAIGLEGYNRNFDWRDMPLPQFGFIVPKMSEVKGFPMYANLVRETSLADYLGYQRGWSPTRQMYNDGTVNSDTQLSIGKFAIPFLVYYDFYRNYLVNPQEGYYPLCTAPDTTQDYTSLPPTDDTTRIWNPGTYVKMNRIDELDNWFSLIHKMYDANSHASTSTPDNWDVLSLNGAPIRWLGYPLFGESDGSDRLPLKCDTFSAFHGGLVGTMFDPDINTNWMSVSNYSRLGSVQVNVLGNQGASYVAYQDMIKASSIWDFVFREVTGGGTYSDLIYSQYGVSVKLDQNIPQIIHVFDTSIGFEDITATADGMNVNESGMPYQGSVVGEQFGVGRGYSQSPSFTVTNPDKNFCMLMTFMWITPNVDYATGLPADSNITKFSDLYFPAFDNYSMQPRFREQWDASVDYGSYQEVDPITQAPTGAMVPNDPFAVGSRIVDSESTMHNWNDVLGYQPAYSEYKTDVNTVHGLFRTGLSYWANVRVIPEWSRFNNVKLSSYVLSAPNGVYTPYLDALGYDTVFSVKDEDNFQCQVRFDVIATRPISKSVMPHIK